jgi:hypothetical protein
MDFRAIPLYYHRMCDSESSTEDHGEELSEMYARGCVYWKTPASQNTRRSCQDSSEGQEAKHRFDGRGKDLCVSNVRTE